MKKCVLLFLSLFATLTASGQEAGNRIYGNAGYYQQKRDATVYNENGTSSRVVQRKAFTFYYEPFQAGSFDSVLAPLGLEPMVQFSLYLRMQYQVKRSSMS